MTQVNNSLEQSSAEISLLDIVNFLRSAWKKLAIASLVGAALGFGVWFFLGSYQAQLPLTNNESLSVLSIRTLQQTLPNLASQIMEKGEVPEGKEGLYRSMSNPDWWKKAITPVYSLTKADIKDLGAEMKDASNSILFVEVNGAASSREAAIQNARDTSQFIHQGGAYFELEGFIRGQQAALMSAQSEIDGKINSNLIELGYKQTRLKSLESLAKRFPGETRTNQVVDAKDSGAKYLPINIQIIAINTDINNSLEDLDRLHDRKLQLAAQREWLAQAQPILTQGYNGLKINQDLLALEAKQRSAIRETDPKSLAFLDSVRNTLVANEAKFKWGLIESSTISAKKTGMIKSTAGGLAAVFFLMLILLVGQKVWLSIKGGAMSGGVK